MSALSPEAEFYRRVAFYRYHPEFDVNEREYKIRLAGYLRNAHEEIESRGAKALTSVRQALRSRDDNIINWRLQVPLFRWFDDEPANALDHLRLLWNNKGDVAEKLATFNKGLASVGIRQPGAQLVISSTLLMARSPQQFPPIRMEAFKAAMDLAGRDSLYSVKSTVDRYLLAQAFMDWMIEDSKRYHIDLRDRLDAQGVIWCLSDGWQKMPVPADWIDDPQRRNALERLEYSKELEDLSKEAGGNELTDTEKDALVKARRGQGKFREAVISFWGNCAVSNCCELTLLRASHIKPWKHSTNYERLDSNNGLLLNANLDAAFDKGLISFEDDGRIIVSAALNVDDRRALGINSGLRIQNLREAHLPYLRYHRDHILKKRETKTLPTESSATTARVK